MNKVNFSIRGIEGYDEVPKMSMTVTDEKGKILDMVYIRWEYNRFICSDIDGNTNVGGSPIVKAVDVKADWNLVRGMLVMCILDHLFIIEDLLKIEVKTPNISSRAYNKIIDTFVIDALRYIKEQDAL